MVGKSIKLICHEKLVSLHELEIPKPPIYTIQVNSPMSLRYVSSYIKTVLDKMWFFGLRVL